MDQLVIRGGQNARNLILSITILPGIGDSDVLKIFLMVGLVMIELYLYKIGIFKR